MGAIDTIIGALIAGLIGVFLEYYRRYLDTRDKHFEEIKEECLKPILVGILKNLEEFFRINFIHRAKEELESERWWENFSFRAKFIIVRSSDDPRGYKVLKVDPYLYDDLPNHYKELAKKLEKIQRLVSEKCPQLLQAAIELSNKIKSDPEFEAFRKGFRARVLYDPREGLRLLYAVLYSSIQLGERYWGKIYEYVKERIDKVKELGNKFRDTEEAKKIEKIQKEVLEEIEQCKEEIENVLRTNKLKGRCRYVRLI